MGKYQPLHDYLTARPQVSRVRMTFAEVAEVLGSSLPKSAFTYREWWANQADTRGRPQAAAWQDAGFKVEDVSQEADGGWVVFARIKSTNR